MVQITKPALRAWQLLLKRVLDFLISAIALVLLSPIFAIIAIAIRVDSAGPVFFRQERVGRGGRRFMILKFRSMTVGAEEQLIQLQGQSLYQDARLFKMLRDPRATRVGNFLRRRSLDELPQLINVVMGQMSLVGPRPPVPQEVALYDEHHYARFEMRPGITGPWQVNGRNNVTDFERVVDLEVAYMRHWSIWKDVAILIQTIPAVVRMDGAH
jgi:lipopolysaccharide/colanic/teichoic acid biosynthesis glycosyltransferase